MPNIRVEKTSCRACHGGCGAVVTLEDGKVTKIRPDSDSPLSRGRMCEKGLAGIELLYNPNRLKYPMKRLAGRGEGKWGRISWDEAYDMIAENIGKIKAENGMESIVIAQGTGRHHFYHTARFANTIGTPNWIEPGTAQCIMPRIQTGMMTYGSLPVVDYYNEKVVPGCALVWGTNPFVSGADCKTPFRMRDVMRKGTKAIVVDPRRTKIAEKAEIWLQIRPGTDAALALGMLHVIISEGLYDQEFVAKWTHGFEALAERVKEYPLHKVSEITWVSPEKIEAAARLFATTKPATLEWGCAIEHTPNAFQTVRAISLLPGITGNFDVPGGFIAGMHMLPDPDMNQRMLSREQDLKRLGRERFPILAGDANGFPGTHIPSVFEAVETGKPYPVRGLMLFGNNALMAVAETKRTYETLKKLDFISCMDLFMTPTAELADVVLPAACWLELDEVYQGPFFADHAVLCQKKLVRTNECKSDEEVFIELTKKLRLDPGADSVEEIYDAQLESVGKRFPQYKNVDFRKLKELNYLETPIEYGQYEKNNGLGTPTGKMELYCTTLEKLGYDPLPYFKEPPESPYSTPEVYKEFPLILTTGGRQTGYFISENRQIKSIRERNPFPIVEIHPETAAKYGIEDGDWVFIESPRGKITQKARLTDGIDPRVVNCQLGWWYPEVKTPDHGFLESNCNVLTSRRPPHDIHTGTYHLRALLCRIEKNPSRMIEERYHNAKAELFGESKGF